MGLFSRKLPQDEMININRPAEKKKEVGSMNKDEKNEISEWAPVVFYTGAEITSTGEMYRDVFENNDIFSEIKAAGWSNANSFAVHESYLSDFNLSRTQKQRYCNVIVEGIGQKVIISNSINTRTSEQKRVKYASNTEDMILIQTILICGVCYSLPLFPNEIVGFYTEKRGLNFVCDGCSDMVRKFHSVDQLHENNVSYFRDAKIVKSMKEFTPTTLLTDYDGMKRPQITKVLPIDRDTIKPGEKNDLRTVSKNNTAIKGEESSSAEKEIESNTPEKERVEIINTALKKSDVIATDRTGISNEFDRTLETLNSINKELTVDSVFNK